MRVPSSDIKMMRCPTGQPSQHNIHSSRLCNGFLPLTWSSSVMESVTCSQGKFHIGKYDSQNNFSLCDLQSTISHVVFRLVWQTVFHKWQKEINVRNYNSLIEIRATFLKEICKLKESFLPLMLNKNYIIWPTNLVLEIHHHWQE